MLDIILFANDEISRRLGLMHRKPIHEDECAFFQFPRLGKHSFWNKNVDFPISLIFCDANLKVKDIKYLEAQQTSGVSPESYDIKYVIEAHVDIPKKLSINKNDRIIVEENKIKIIK
jgi:uncharacterized membrane protein (UPF0127 family)